MSDALTVGEIYSHEELLDYVDTIDAKAYARTRNHRQGDVTRLSAYLTHGIVSLQDVIARLAQRYSLSKADKLYKELMRKEFFVHVAYHDRQKSLYENYREDTTSPARERKDILPARLVQGETDTTWVNEAVDCLGETGYLHNHVRMRLASWTCHVAGCDWRQPAQWTYYHFLDGELGSNHLSWQWVQSTFGTKPYIMNSGNIKKYTKNRSDPQLDMSYEDLSDWLWSDRELPYHEDEDVRDILQTDYGDCPERSVHHRDILGEGNSCAVLTPWDLHPEKIASAERAVVVLDTEFLQLHPWSKKRVDFVRSYAEHYGVECVQGSYEKVIADCTAVCGAVHIYESVNPVYQEVFQSYCADKNVQAKEYPWINPRAHQEVIPKFFRYYRAGKPGMKKLFS